jgi:fructose-1,6-bisphosphatase/inositol monophosphatase family enzyme
MEEPFLVDHRTDLSQHGKYEPELNFAMLLAYSAGEFLKQNQKTTKGVQEKPDGSLISERDKSVSRFLFSKIREKFPGHAIFDEEVEDGYGGIGDGPSRSDSEYCWFTDPLDNTQNYLHGLDHYAVLVGLTREFQPLVGVARMPSRDESVFGVKGQGAFYKKGNGEQVRVGVNPYSEVIYSNLEDLQRLEKILREEGLNLKVRRGNTLNTLDVALGRAQAFIGGINGLGSLWDVAAPSLIVQEAGGFMSNLYGRNHDFRQNEKKLPHGILAHAGAITSELREKIAKLNKN